MATTSTLGTARVALKTAMDTGALSGNVHYAWPGPLADKPEVVWIGDVKNWTQAIAGLKAGRKMRQEEYTFEVILWVYDATLDSTGAQTVFERALVLAAVIESALAADVLIGTTVLQWVTLEERVIDLFPYEKSWACQIKLSIECNARLT